MGRWLLGVALLASAGAAPAQPLQPWTGGPLPPIELEDVDGRMHRLAEYRGKVVLVNFWATWCAPCREEMPTIERLRRELDGRPFVVLAVNVGEGARAVRGFIQQVPVGFALLMDRDTRTAKAWQAKILPATFIVDPAGRVRYRYFGERDWSSGEAFKAIVALLPARKS